MQNRSYLAVAAVTAAAILLIGATRTRASEPLAGQMTPGTRAIRVSGTAVVYGKPDYATIELGVVKLSPRVMDAKAACDQAMMKVQAAIRKAGVAANDIQTTNFQIYSVQPTGKPAAPRQWKVVHEITVKVRNVASVASLLDAAVSSGVTDVSQVTYSLEKIMELRSKARAEAVRVAHEKAQELARLNNVQLGDPITINDSGYEGSNTPVQYTMNSSIDYPGIERRGGVMSQGQIAVDAREDIEFAIR